MELQSDRWALVVDPGRDRSSACGILETSLFTDPLLKSHPMGKTTAVFVDTNIFIQCRRLKDLPWHELFAGKDVLLVISYVCGEEIEKFKSGPDLRRQKRARDALPLLDSLLSAENHRIVLVPGPPEVACQFGLMWAQVERPDGYTGYAMPDERIVIEALHWTQRRTDLDVVVLSLDVPLAMRAANLGVASVRVPAVWRLPPEIDPRDRQIKVLESEIQAMRSRQPFFEIGFRYEGDSTFSVHLTPEYFAAFTESEVDVLVSETVAILPIVTRFDGVPPRPHSDDENDYSLVMPKENDVLNYQDLYEKWIAKLRVYFSRIPAILSYEQRHAAFEATVRNAGPVPATTVAVTLTCHGGAKLTPPGSNQGRERREQRAQQLLTLPPRPQPPKASWVSSVPRVSSMVSDMLLPQPFMKEGRNIEPSSGVFSWSDPMPTSYQTAHKHQAPELSHHAETTIFPLLLLLPTDTTPSVVRVVCSVTSNDTPLAATQALSLSIEPTFVSAMEEARKRIAVAAPVRLALNRAP